MGEELRESDGVGAERVERFKRQLMALQQVSRRWRHYEGDVEGAVTVITETATRALAAERASVWIYRDLRRTIHCADLYESTPHRHSHGLELSAADYPNYFEAMMTEEIIAAQDARNDPRTRDFAETYLEPNGIGAILDAPIRVGTRCIGVLCIEHVGGPREFHNDEINSAIYFADLVGAAHEMSRRIDSELEARRSASLLRATFEATGAAIIALDRSGHVFDNNRRATTMWDLPPELLSSSGNPATLMHHMANRTDDPEHFVSRTKAIAANPDADSHDVVTLTDGRVVECTSQPQELDGQVIGRIWSFRDITRQHQVEQELLELSLHDPLTGLLNRRAIDPILEKEIMRARRTKQALCVAMVDIDCFKSVNDEHGHPVGDAVLERLAVDLEGRLRATDHTARWGGEEFLVILPDTDREGAVKLFEEVREYIAREREAIPDFTVSVGIAQLVDDESGAELVAEADRRLYQAKADGRNCVKA